MVNDRLPKIVFQYGEISYRQAVLSNSPYFFRNTPIKKYSTDKTRRDLSIGKCQYTLGFANQINSYIDRPQFNISRFLPTFTGFISCEDLKANPKAVDFSLNLLIDDFLALLEEDTNAFLEVANSIQRTTDEVGYAIRRFVAFDQVSTWDQFLDVMRGIKKTNIDYRFELFSALIIQFSEKFSFM